MDQQWSNTCQLLGGLLLEGHRLDLLQETRRTGVCGELAAQHGGALGEALAAMQHALETQSPQALALEFTRLMVVNGDAARATLPVPPWESAYASRTVMGETHRAVMLVYASAGLGFDGMKDRPNDHIGLELCFAAALLDGGPGATRTLEPFVRHHLRPLLVNVGSGLATHSRVPFWTAVGRALLALEAQLDQQLAAHGPVPRPAATASPALKVL